MSEVVAADRSRLLRSKRAESSGIVTSRKRKLREFFAVCDNEEPLPTINLSNPDAPSTNDAEQQFLDNCDIIKDRLFDEAHLPARRQLRSSTAKQQQQHNHNQQSLAPPASPDSRNSDTSRKSSRTPRKDGSRKSRTPTPGVVVEQKTDPVPDLEKQQDGKVNSEGIPMQRSSSKGSQTDLPADSAAVLDEIVDETVEHAIDDKSNHPSIPNSPAPPGALESERIVAGVESQPGSPGIDPRKAAPVSAEEAAQLPEPLIYGQASHDEQHKAATVHLPPREVQEQRLRNKAEHSSRTRKHQEQLSINLPGREAGRHAETLSSPGSTSHSATTPALHDASTDTSPDNEGSRFETERLEDKDEVPETPPELRPTPQEVAEKEEHDRILNAQIDIARAEILRSSPAAIDAQIRLEEQAAAESSQAAVDAQMADVDSVPNENPDGLTEEAGEVVQDIVDDQPEPSATETEPNTESAEAAEPPGSQNSGKASEIPDSEAPSTPGDAMDVDTTTVKDSFETNPSSDAPAAAPSPAPEETTQETSEKPAEEPVEATPLTPAASTPQRMPSAAPPSNGERMTTRVASGAIRHKSVSEILGEIPRPNTASASDRSAVEKSATGSSSNSPSRSTTPQSPGTRVRSLIERAKEKERSKLSTVVFAKQPVKRNSSDVALVSNGKKKSHPENEDYFLPMWRARPDVKNQQSIESLLQSAHKTVTTSNSYVPFLDNQTYRVLKRIKDLQEMGKWSLRQPKRSPEPNRQTSHWDLVIQEAKWMRTDFREERKWKMAVARNLAFACAEWIEASDDDRKLLQVKAILPPKVLAKDVEMTDASSQAHSTPDLIASAEVDSPFEDLDDVPRFNLNDTVSPTAIFGLQDDDVIFGLRQSPATDKLLNELPLYGTPLTVPQVSFAQLDVDPDAAWRRPVLPLSKYVEGRMVLKSEGPPRKKSRYEYEDEDEDEDDLVFGEPYAKRPQLPPQSSDVALFNPENKHIRDRIHAGHQFRPPSEYQMPLQSFFECRTGSQWTWAEDDELKTLVRSYTYNWSLISNMLTSKSMFSSGAERRTPWECFERWIHLEGLPSDMQKTHYFRAYNTRLEMAQRALTEQAQAAPPQPNAAGQIVPPRRRTTTTSVRVERRRNQKHLTLVDAMRKLAKKRETNLQKQQHAAGLAAMRKANEVAQPRGATHTPQDFSRLKFEREQQMQERMARYNQQQELNRRAAAQLVRNGQNPQQGAPNGGQPLQMNRGPAPANGINGQQPPNPNQLAVPGQNRPRAPMVPNPMAPVSMQNGLQVPQMHMNGVPQAQMQSRLPPPNPAPMLDMNTMAQSRRIADQQRHAVQLQQQGQSSQVRNSPPNMRNVPNVPNGATQPFMPNANMMPPFNSNGVSTPPAHALNTPGSAGSPRLGQPGPQPLSNGMVPHVAAIEAQLRAKFPNATPEQHNAMVREHLKQIKGPQLNQAQLSQAQLQQAAMNAAAGGNMNGINGNGGQPRVPSGVENSPQLYAQMLRAQQERQQQQQQQQQQQLSQQAQTQPQSHPQNQTQPTTQAQPVQQQTQQTNPAAGQTPRAGSASSPGGK